MLSLLGVVVLWLFRLCCLSTSLPVTRVPVITHHTQIKIHSMMFTRIQSCEQIQYKHQRSLVLHFQKCNMSSLATFFALNSSSFRNIPLTMDNANSSSSSSARSWNSDAWHGTSRRKSCRWGEVGCRRGLSLSSDYLPPKQRIRSRERS